MAFDWREYVTVARDMPQLQSISSNEAKLRCAVSRAYYGVYCNTRNHAMQRLNYVSTAKKFKRSEHADLRLFLNGEGGVFPVVAADLERLHNLRKQCDYDDVVLNCGVLYREALRLAAKIMGNVP
jgi:hypothetical protein